MKPIKIDALEKMRNDDNFATVAFGIYQQGFSVEELINIKAMSLTKKMAKAAKNNDNPKLNYIEAQLTGVLAIKDLLPCCRYVWKSEKPIEPDYIKILLESKEKKNDNV